MLFSFQQIAKKSVNTTIIYQCFSSNHHELTHPQKL